MRPATRLTSRVSAWIALLPCVLIVLGVYVGCTLWTIRISMTNSRMLPSSEFVGLRQYRSLMVNSRWIVSVENLVILGVLFVLFSLALGLLMAIFIDQKVRSENLLRAVFLYPYSMSFIVTGLVWHWMLSPTLGIQKLGRDLGFEHFRFDWIVDQNMVIYTLVIASVWHASGLVMSIMLAGLRGIDEEIWNAIRIDGIPSWRAYAFIILPMLKGSVATATVLLSISIVRLYDLVVAMTNGGPGIASEVPAKFVMDHLFERANVGLATAASTMMLITVIAVVAPWLYVRSFQRSRRLA
jgi:glucose/mannose transport system permease protein